MVALAHGVRHVAETILRVNVAHEALLPSTVRTLELLLSATRHFRGLQLITVIVVRHYPNLLILIHPSKPSHICGFGWLDYRMRVCQKGKATSGEA